VGGLSRETLLYRAVSSLRVEIVRLLLEHGADVRSVREDRPLLHAAVSKGWRRALKGVDWSRGAALEVAELLISHSVNLGARDKSGRTALSVSCGLGWLEMAALLVEHGADVAEGDGIVLVLLDLLQAGQRKVKLPSGRRAACVEFITLLIRRAAGRVGVVACSPLRAVGSGA
jgi:ankyrin repeat protein